MTDNVVPFTGDTKLDIPPEKVLQAAIGAELDLVVVVGVKDGELYLAGSCADLIPTHWWLCQAQKKLLEMGND